MLGQKNYLVSNLNNLSFMDENKSMHPKIIFRGYSNLILGFTTYRRYILQIITLYQENHGKILLRYHKFITKS